MTERQTITEEMGVHKEWAGKWPKSLDELTEHVRHVTEDYEHDYGTCVYAAAAAAQAAYNYVAHVEGMTVFQMSCVMWELVRDLHSGDGSPLRLVDYENLLYPQYAYKFQPTISTETWEWAQEKAMKNLAEREACKEVRDHWKDIASGLVPFGLTVVDDD